MTKLLNEQGVEVEYKDIPDWWPAYIWLKHHISAADFGGTSIADMVLDCWHQAIDYKAVALGTGKAKLLIEKDDYSAKGLTDRLIYNEMVRLSELMEIGITDSSTPDPLAEFAAWEKGYPEICQSVIDRK